jgi:hypothetical protein
LKFAAIDAISAGCLPAMANVILRDGRYMRVLSAMDGEWFFNITTNWIIHIIEIPYLLGK